MLFLLLFIGVPVGLFVGINLLVKSKKVKKSNEIRAAGRMIKRESQFMDHTVVLDFQCAHPEELLRTLQKPGYLMSYQYSVTDADDKGFSISCVEKPSWDAVVQLEPVNSTTTRLVLMFTKWGDWATLQWGSANECLTVLERTVLGVYPNAQMARFPTPLENSPTQGLAGMLGTALHNLSATRDAELKFHCLADEYRSEPAFQANFTPQI